MLVVLQMDKQDGEHYFHKGDPGDFFYIIKEGTIKLKDGDKVVATVSDGMQASGSCNHQVMFTLLQSLCQVVCGELARVMRAERVSDAWEHVTKSSFGVHHCVLGRGYGIRCQPLAPQGWFLYFRSTCWRCFAARVCIVRIFVEMRYQT